MPASARVALVLLVFADFGLAGCTSIDELKGTVSSWFVTENVLGEHQRVYSDSVSDDTRRISPKETAGKEPGKASNKKNKTSRKLRPQTAERPNKSEIFVPAQAARPQREDVQSASSPAAAPRLPSGWSEAPAPGTFSR
jgi:hypothetical protein